MLLGLLLIGNAVNLLILTVGGPSGNPPIFGRTSAGRSSTADPLAQGMILTAIVISMGVAAFVLALAYRSYRLTTAEEVPDDPEDTRVSQQTEDEVEEDVVHPEPELDVDEPAELDAVPGALAEGPRNHVNIASALTPLPVLIPAVGAALTMFVGRHPRLQRSISLAALTAVVAVCVALIYLTDQRGTIAVQVGGWGPTVPGLGPLGITLVVDRLSALMMVVSSIVLLAVVLYAIGQGIRDGDERQPVSIFLPTYLVLSAGVCGAFLAGDLFNLFVGFEVLLTASFVLLTIGASADRVRAGIAYVMVSMVASLIFLFAIALIYAATGTLNMAELAVRLDDVAPGTRSALFAVLLVAFGIKAAVFPLSTWLPDSYPTAPAPVTAVFAGLLTKVGVYAIIRAHSLLFPSGGLDSVLLVAALLTMLVGVLGAIAQNDIKRLLSFTLVSHIGFMVFGIALANRPGMSGRDLLRRAPHHRADDAVPGRRADRTAGRRVDAAPTRRARHRQPAAGAAVPAACAQSRWDSTVFGLPRQGRTASGRRPGGVGAGVGARRRGSHHQLADAVRGHPRVQQGVLASARRRTRG